MGKWQSKGVQTRVAKKSGRHRQQIHQLVRDGQVDLDWIENDEEEEAAAQWIKALCKLDRNPHYLTVAQIIEQRGSYTGLRALGAEVKPATWGKRSYYHRDDVRAFYRRLEFEQIEDTPLEPGQVMTILEMSREGYDISKIMSTTGAPAFDVRAVILEAESQGRTKGRPPAVPLTRDVQRQALNAYLLHESWSEAMKHTGLSRHMMQKIVDTHKKRMSKHRR